MKENDMVMGTPERISQAGAAGERTAGWEYHPGRPAVRGKETHTKERLPVRPHGSGGSGPEGPAGGSGAPSDRAGGGKRKKRYRLKKKVLIPIIVAVAVLAIGGLSWWLAATTPGWHINGERSYYIMDGTRSRAKGFYTVEGVEYLFSDRGFLMQGWSEYDGKTYYIGADNVRAYGAATIEGVEYYFDPDDGVYNTGLLEAGEGVYGFSETGFPLEGYSQIEEDSYYFDDETLLMQTGWFDAEKARYYALETGVLQKEWQEISSKTYYFEPKTAQMQRGVTAVDGKKYLLDADGVLQKGIAKIGEDTYLADENGLLLTGWQELKEKKYYLNPEDGKMFFGVHKIGDDYYVLDKETGAMAAAAFATVDEKTYYLGEDGKAYIGWQTVEGNSHYFNGEAVMAVGYQTIEGNNYFFAENGALMKGFQDIGGVLHYFGEDGIIRAGSFEHSGASRLFGADGRILSGWQTLGGATYYYVDGIKQTGTVNIGGANYNLNDDGILRTGWQGNQYWSEAGYPVTGWHTIDGGLRYFDEAGNMVRSTKVGEYNIDGNGVAHKEVVAPSLGDPGTAFNWVRANMRYASIGDSGYAGNVQYALNNKRGACYHYAALLLHTMGGQGAYITGTNPQGGRHDWVQVGDTVYDATNGWICSVDEMRAKGYNW